MAKQIFDKFFQTPIGQQINDNLQKTLQRAKGGVVIFLSRKGYWLYQIYRRYAGWKQKIYDDITIISDRYISKWYEESWNGKPLFIVDDTITTGISMFNVFKKVRHQYSESKITCITFFMRMSHQELRKLMMAQLSDGIRPQDIDELNVFLDCLEAYEKVTFGQIGWLSYEQIYLFQKLMVPYVVDLPVLTDVNYEYNYEESERNHHYSVLGYDTFEKLKQICGDWRYEDNSYLWDNFLNDHIQTEKIQNGFFCYLDPNIYSRVGRALLEIVIRCRHELNEQGNWNVVFTPFAIVKSVPFEEAQKMCLDLYQGTDFGDWLSKNRVCLEEKKHSTLMFRSIVYFLSLYGWSAFCRAAEEFLGSKLPMQLDTRMLGENSDSVFIRTVDQMKNWEKENFLQNLQKIEPIDGMTGAAWYKKKLLQGDDIKNAYLLLYRAIIERKRDKPCQTFIAIEELYDMIDSSVEDKDETKRMLFIKVLLQMLDQSIFGNAVEYREDVIFRGFRFGENSEVALPFYNKYIYYGVENLYSRCIWKAEYDSEEARKIFFGKIHSLFYGMRIMAQKGGYLNEVIDEKDLEYNEQYFSDERADLRTLVENKRFRINLDRRLDFIEYDMDFCVNELVAL